MYPKRPTDGDITIDCDKNGNPDADCLTDDNQRKRADNKHIEYR